MQNVAAQKNPWISAFDDDLSTHKRNRAGQVVAQKHYRMHRIGETTVFEVPPGSGNLFYEKDKYFTEPAGRLIQVDEEITDKRTGQKRKHKAPAIDFGAAHVAYTAPLTSDQILANETAEMRSQNEVLKRELAALKAERESLEQTKSAPKEQRK